MGATNDLLRILDELEGQIDPATLTQAARESLDELRDGINALDTEGDASTGAHAATGEE